MKIKNEKNMEFLARAMAIEVHYSLQKDQLGNNPHELKVLKALAIKDFIINCPLVINELNVDAFKVGKL